MAHVRDAQARIEPVDSPASLRAAGIDVRIGAARFTGPDTLTVDGDPVRFRAAVVASGSEPVVPRIEGLAGPGVVSSDTVWQLTALPERLVVTSGWAVQVPDVVTYRTNEFERRLFHVDYLLVSLALNVVQISSSRVGCRTSTLTRSGRRCG